MSNIKTIGKLHQEYLNKETSTMQPILLGFIKYNSEFKKVYIELDIIPAPKKLPNGDSRIFMEVSHGDYYSDEMKDILEFEEWKNNKEK